MKKYIFQKIKVRNIKDNNNQFNSKLKNKFQPKRELKNK